MSDSRVTVIYFWKIKSSNIGFALLRMALDRVSLRRIQGVHFAKMLGTGKGETFTPRDADANQWGALIVIDRTNLQALDNSKLITYSNSSISIPRAAMSVATSTRVV